MTDPHPHDAHPHEAPDPDQQAGDVPPLELRWRSSFGAPPPRRIRLEIPGWSGQAVRPTDGATAQPWHCHPFVEGATHGLELVYPYESETRVRVEDGRLHFEGGLNEEMKARGLSNPFGVFARGHFGMDTMLDLLPPPGYALRLGPHPRFFTDTTGEVPLALPGHIQRFWPRQFFAVFRAPAPGTTTVFRPGEPYAQLLLVRVGEAVHVQPMEPEEMLDRQRQERQVATLSYLLSRRLWKSAGGIWFGDKYRQLLRIFRTGGVGAVRRHLQALEERATPRPRG